MFLPKNNNFYPIFDQMGQTVLKSAQALKHFVSSPPLNEAKLKALEDIEHAGDELTHECLQLLHKSFITPLDREDIHSIVSSMDDCIDFIFGSANKMVMYKIPSITPGILSLVDILEKMTAEIAKAVPSLKNLKKPEMVLAQCIDLGRLENDADNIHRSAVAALFDNEKDPLVVIKMKEILDHLETATDRCKDVANVLEGIVLKNA